MKSVTELAGWVALKEHAASMQILTLNDLYQNSPDRHATFVVNDDRITLDFSNQRINASTIDLLLNIADERALREKIYHLMQGGRVNQSEQQPALHTALRAGEGQSIVIDGKDIMPDILQTRKKMQLICEQIRSGSWLGYTGKAINTVIHIGIGGSELGPRFCMKALTNDVTPHLAFHFISDADPEAFSMTVAMLNPETTLFIVASKSFTTQETLYNMQKAMEWVGLAHVKNHFIAVTEHEARAKFYGIHHVLPIWRWIGGRYSACSAINLITTIAIGYEKFSEILDGAHKMDLHFRDTDFRNNLPVLLALIGIWNNNFLFITQLLVLAYTKHLEYFIPYIQQLDMESNGKSVDIHGRAINYSTGPIVWGGLGMQAQHSYYQLLSQGTHRVTLDLITLKSNEHELIHEAFLSKKLALVHGVSEDQNPLGYIPGNVPLTHISLADCSPMTIGELIALYEHKVYVQSVIWDINPFDQQGVESSKRSRLAVITQPNVLSDAAIDVEPIAGCSI